MIEIGFTFTNASSTLGSVSGSTNALDRNVSGKMNMKPAFITALGERRSSPSVVNSQLTPNENTTVSPSAAITPSAPPSGRNPRMRPSVDDHGAGDDVAHGVAEQRADERRRAARSAACGTGPRRPS